MNIFYTAIKNLKKNFSFYSLYLLSVSFVITVFFAFTSFSVNKIMLEKISTDGRVESMCNVISIFLMAFVIFYMAYSNRFFLRRRTKELGIYEQVIFIGKSSDVLKEISHSKVFVFASDFEGMPNAILEALSMGVPVITTDYSPGGAIELVSEKERGFVVPRGNEKLLAEKMIYTLNNVDRAAEMSSNAVGIYMDNSETETLKRWMEYITYIAHCEMKRGAED